MTSHVTEREAHSIEEHVDGFTRRLILSPGWDKRDPDPRKDYGIGAVRLRCLLIGPEGATQFLLLTGWDVPSARRPSSLGPWSELGHEPCPADLGYHWPTPQYEGQTDCDCDVLPGGRCFYDGSGLQANDVYDRLTVEGLDAVWDCLAERYESLRQGGAA